MPETYCHEEITSRDGMLDACNLPAVGERIDPEHLSRYPVCERHFRGTGAVRYAVILEGEK